MTAPASTDYAAAVALVTPRIDGDAVWLLAQDTAPERETLARLAGALELSPSAAFAAPKLVRWDDRSEIVSLGVGMTRFGRAVGLADGELDQGQHDGRDDVLGADVRGLLVRADAWRELGGLDPALAGADEGLDLGVRARLAGARVSLAPTAIVATAGDGVAGFASVLRDTTDEHRERERLRAAEARLRQAQRMADIGSFEGDHRTGEARWSDELFRLLGDPTRVRMLYALAEAGELCVGDLAAVVDVPETSASHALRLLRTAGVVRSRRSGRLVYYSLDDAHVRVLLAVSAEHLRHDPA